MSIIGAGPEGSLCRELINKAGLQDKIELLGAMAHAEVLQHMNDSDIFVLNARTSKQGDMEGTPVSILEAMSMELPVIATYHAGIPQVLTNQENGLLIAENDQTGLAIALETLISNENLRADLGQQARQTIVSKFGIELNRQRIAELFA